MCQKTILDLKQQMIHITIMLSQNNQLQGLYLGDNYLQSEGAVKIARGMKGTSSVELNISNNNICGKAVNDIAAILSCNHNL